MNFILFLVTVYTQFGYAMVDLEKYKDELQNGRSESSSPDKSNKEESEKNEHKENSENPN